jgi:hypothetical protein
MRGLVGRWASDAGTSIVETTVAMGLLATVTAGLLAMPAMALTQTENQGHLAARTAEYAADKMEQLLVLSYGDDTSAPRVFPATPSSGTGLAVGGSANPDAPVAGYVDHLDERGNLLVTDGVTPPANWYYRRVWQVTEVTATLKEVRVAATVARSIGRTQRPSATLATLKTFPF